MKRERSYLPQDFFVDRFTSGVSNQTLLSSYWYARKYEQAYLDVKETTHVAPRVYPQQQNQRHQLPRDSRNRPPNNNRGPYYVGTAMKISFLDIDAHRCREP
jgi:hypothetical protein